jgi:hypothetical protein
MESIVNAIIAKDGVVADASAVRERQSSPIAAPCGAWERSHASTTGMTTGGVRLLPATTTPAERLIDAAHGSSTSFPFSGPSTLSPPV